MLKDSSVLNLLSQLDVNDDSVSSYVRDSFLFKVFSKVAGVSRSLWQQVADTSFFIKNIDNFILAVITLMIVASTVLGTGIIGALSLLAFMLLIVKFLVVKSENLTFTAVDLAVGAYIAVAALSVTFSSLFLPSLKGFIKMFIYFGGYLSFVSMLRNNPKRVIYIIGLVAFTVSLEAMYAIYQQLTGVEELASWQDMANVNPEQLMDRVYGSLKPFNPNLLAGYLVAGFSFALTSTFYFLNKKNVRVTILSAVGVLAIMLAILFTGSRGAYMATAVMLGVFTLISGHIIHKDYAHIQWLKKLWVWGIVAAIAGVLLLIAVSPALQHRVLSIFALRGDSSNSYRLNVYNSCFNIIKDNWLTGIGTGNTTFRLVYGLYMVTGFDALGAYSVPLEVLVEMGVFGFMAFLWLLAVNFIRGIKTVWAEQPMGNKIIVSGCIIGMSGLIFHGFFDTVFYRPQINILFWLIVAIMSVVTTKGFSTEK